MDDQNSIVPDADVAASSFPPVCRPPITIRSMTRTIQLWTPLDDEDAWQMLLVPDGSTDAQVLEWAEQTLPPAAVEKLREVIEREADT
jgi:hypothetical protein